MVLLAMKSVMLPLITFGLAHFSTIEMEGSIYVVPLSNSKNVLQLSNTYATMAWQICPGCTKNYVDGSHI